MITDFWATLIFGFLNMWLIYQYSLYNHWCGPIFRKYQIYKCNFHKLLTFHPEVLLLPLLQVKIICRHLGCIPWNEKKMKDKSWDLQNWENHPFTQGNCCVKSGCYNLSADGQSHLHGSTPTWSKMIVISDNSPVATKLQRFDHSGKALFWIQIIIIVAQAIKKSWQFIHKSLNTFIFVTWFSTCFLVWKSIIFLQFNSKFWVV